MARLLALTACMAVVTVGICSASSMAKSQSCAPGAFLAKRANTVEALVKQISSSPTVARRYAKIFRTTPAKVAAYVHLNVKMVTLKQPLKTKVYFVGDAGQIHSKTIILKTGSRVFVAGNGDPLMDARCGNPLRRTLPPVPIRPPKTREKTSVQEFKPKPPPAESFVPPPTESVPRIERAAPQPVAPSAVAPPSPKPSVPKLARIAAPALLAVGAVHTSGGAVPEPGTVIAALGILLPAGIIFRRRCK